jgi:TatD DNase family protein
MLIDTHTHLDDKKYQDDIDEVLQRAYKNNIKYFIIPGADINDLKRAVALSNIYDNIYFSVGVHPYNIKDLDISYLKKFITHKKCVGVGECGLDYYRLPKNKDEALKEKELQKQGFIAQIELAIEFDLPLIVHIEKQTKIVLRY